MASKEFPSEKAFESQRDSDVETLERTSDDFNGEVKLVRQLKNRHIAMIRCVMQLVFC
jgi:amino acid permease